MEVFKPNYAAGVGDQLTEVTEELFDAGGKDYTLLSWCVNLFVLRKRYYTQVAI